MTTRRDNMFYYRGACSAYSTILQIMKKINTDEVDAIDSLNVIYIIEDRGDSFYD